ncbi:succinate dehydrogenase assembly factor 1 mitochondrial [Biomphalaria pfeifferi]|uniref:Succinate dehydrogenase assembly factor 1 mitochondrial n=1 Tax=Biomphalaria pfeifferi TaxID=112525 RepID=A0AAD8B2X7_BIOPF|nr:succinate dehydrogenase assembly factor 1 mitochondrial [Biomphalaria pfeifferi]
MAMRHSKVQKQVLSLYKQFLKVTKDKPSFQDYVRQEFRQNAELSKSDVIKIDYLLRRGWRQLEVLKSSAVKSAGVFVKDIPSDQLTVSNDKKPNSS